MNKYIAYTKDSPHIQINHSGKIMTMRCEHCGEKLLSKSGEERLNFYDVHKLCKKKTD